MKKKADSKKGIWRIAVNLIVFAIAILYICASRSVWADTSLISGQWTYGETNSSNKINYTFTMPSDGNFYYDVIPYSGYYKLDGVKHETKDYFINTSMSANGKTYVSTKNALYDTGYRSGIFEFSKGTAVTVSVFDGSRNYQTLFKVRAVYVPYKTPTVLSPNKWASGETFRNMKMNYAFTLPSDGTVSFELVPYSGYYIENGIRKSNAYFIYTSMSAVGKQYIDSKAVYYSASGYKSGNYELSKGNTVQISVFDGAKDYQTLYKVRVLFTPKATSLDISDAFVTLSQSTYTYNGSSKKPALKVVLAGNTLKEGTDYSVSYSNNKNAGTATVTIKGKGNYTGSKKVYFTINPASISNASVTLSKTSYVCNGKARKPSVTVKLNKKKLGSQNYTVSYSNNTNPGKATVKVTGITNYTGSVTKTFSITLSTPSLSLSSKNNGEVVAKCGTVKGATKYQIQYYKKGSKTVKSSSLNPSATMTVTGLTPSAYYYVRARAYASSSSGSVYSPYSSYKRIKVFKATKDLSKAKMTFTQPNTLWVYTGSQICPGVKIKNGIITLQKGTDYTLSYSNNINAGTAKVTATGRGKYYGSLSKSFVIGKKGINSSDVSILESVFTYSSKAIEPPIAVIVNKRTLRNGTDYTVSYKNNVNAGTATVVVKGKGNYSGTVNKTFVIQPLSILKCKVSLPQGDRYAYKENLRPPVLVMYNENTIDYREDLNYRLDYDVREDSDVGHVTVTGVKNLEGSVTLDFKVIKGFIWPAKTTNEAINTLYYYNTFNNGGPHSSHFANFNSIDIGPDGQSNVAIVAVADGIVTTSAYSTDSGFGNYIVIRHDDGTETWYCHLADRHVFKGDEVKQGQTIGIMGNSSAKYKIGIHLHFEWSGGNPWEKYYKDTCNNVKIASDVYQANSRHTSNSTCKALIDWIDDNCQKVNGYYVFR